MRRTRNAKIVATLGPAGSHPAIVRQLFLAGVDGFRLNASHGSHADHSGRFKTLRALEHETGRPIGILADLQGPKLRAGCFVDGPVMLAQGQACRLDLDKAPGTAQRDRGAVRCGDGGARRPGCRPAGRARACHSEAHRAHLPTLGQAGHRGHADAGVDDRQPGPHARRSLRCGHCHPPRSAPPGRVRSALTSPGAPAACRRTARTGAPGRPPRARCGPHGPAWPCRWRGWWRCSRPRPPRCRHRRSVRPA